MRKPNGYGSIIKLSGKRRKPYAVRLTLGWSAEGKQQYKYLDYFTTRRDAEIALAEYNKNPYSISKDVTMSELYDIWSPRFYSVKADNTIANYERAWKKCQPLYNMKIKDIKLFHLQSVADQMTNGVFLQAQKVWSNMFSYAIKNDLLPPDRANMVRYVENHNITRMEHNIFSNEEIEHLWTDEKYAMILILIYSGVRISELLDLKTKDVHIDKQYFDIVAAKTAAGIRQVPIADKILPLWRNLLTDTEYFITPPRGTHFSYQTFKLIWNKLTNHRPHDTRHTFISLMTEAEVDDRILKQIVGHKGTGVTESVYTHISLEKKLEAVNMI